MEERMYKHDDILRTVQDEKTGITDYYAYVNKNKVKITKEQYRYLERVNRRQRYLNELAAQLNCVSYTCHWDRSIFLGVRPTKALIFFEYKVTGHSYPLF